jgi:hypothetical protein
MSAASELLGDLGHVESVWSRAQGKGDLLTVDPKTGGEGVALCQDMAGIGGLGRRDIAGWHGMPSHRDEVAARGDDLGHVLLLFPIECDALLAQRFETIRLHQRIPDRELVGIGRQR